MGEVILCYKFGQHMEGDWLSQPCNFSDYKEEYIEEDSREWH